MNKQTKKNKRSNKRKNKTMKYYYGGEDPKKVLPPFPTNVSQVLPPVPPPVPQVPPVLPSTPPLNNTQDKETIVGIVGDKLTDYAGNTFNYLKDKVIDHATKPANATKEENEKKEDNNEGLISTAINVVDKVSGAVVSKVNDFLKKPEFQKGIADRVGETIETLKEFNEKVSTPEAKKAIEESAENLADVSEKVLDKLDEPIDKAIDKLGESGQKIASAAVSGAIKVGTDAATAVPGVGALIEIPNIATQLANSASKITGAVSNITSTVKDVSNEVKNAFAEAEAEAKAEAKTVNTITPNVDEKKINGGGINNFNQQKIIARQIGGRIQKSILEFENPLQNKNKTRRKFYKQKRSTTNKRTHFSI